MGIRPGPAGFFFIKTCVYQKASFFWWVECLARSTMSVKEWRLSECWSLRIAHPFALTNAAMNMSPCPVDLRFEDLVASGGAVIGGGSLRLLLMTTRLDSYLWIVR